MSFRSKNFLFDIKTIALLFAVVLGLRAATLLAGFTNHIPILDDILSFIIEGLAKIGGPFANLARRLFPV